MTTQLIRFSKSLDLEGGEIRECVHLEKFNGPVPTVLSHFVGVAELTPAHYYV